MNQSTPILSLQIDPETGLGYIQRALKAGGLGVQCSFDLQVARTSHANCTCPHHGTERCTCQMVILLVYQARSTPTTLVVQGYEGNTQISLVDNLRQHPDSEMVAAIYKALRAGEFSMRVRWEWIET